MPTRVEDMYQLQIVSSHNCYYSCFDALISKRCQIHNASITQVITQYAMGDGQF